MTKPLSPAAQAVLTAVTQQEYCLDPSDIPNEAARIGCLVAAALLAAAPLMEFVQDHQKLLAIAAELEGQP